MYETLPPLGFSAETVTKAYTEFLSDLPRFEHALNKVITQWPISCEQFLSNANINRIAWLGQSSMCIATGIPRQFKAGFSALSERAQIAANAMADKYLTWWLAEKGNPTEEGYELPTPKGMQSRILHYIKTWQRRGYQCGIPDEVPSELMRLNLAPSYKAISQAILKNDHTLSSLGYIAPISPWYGVFKRIELENRNTMNDPFFL